MADVGAAPEEAAPATGLINSTPQPQPGLIDSAPAPKNLLEQARDQYPILKGVDLNYVETPAEGKGYLEFWPPNETGSPDYPRPDELPAGKPGLQIFRKDTRPVDVLGDVVSHHLVKEDDLMQHYYDQFATSLTDKQNAILEDQYAHARATEGEKRPFDEWKEQTGLPAYFRGYAFGQWGEGRDDPAIKGLYTQHQLDMFDSMMRYLKSAPADAKEKH